MAHIAIFVSAISVNDKQLHVDGIANDGIAYVSDLDHIIGWGADIDFTDLTANINQAIKDAAIAAALDAGSTVSALDKKTVYGAAIGL